MSNFLRTPKGTMDLNPRTALLTEDIIEKVINVFKRHGAVTIQTPTFELKSLLTSKYGEDEKLIFDLKDQGGDICSLRYDLTVSLARYIAQNKIQKFKRYQIGNVFRRDQPALTKGRCREFIQCDFDIIGSYSNMCADAEIIKIATTCLKELIQEKFIFKIGHRKILKAIFTIAAKCDKGDGDVCDVGDVDKEGGTDVCSDVVKEGDEIGAVGSASEISHIVNTAATFTTNTNTAATSPTSTTTTNTNTTNTNTTNKTTTNTTATTNKTTTNTTATTNKTTINTTAATTTAGEIKKMDSFCSTIDKIDKLTKTEIFNELKTKGASEKQINKIWSFVSLKGEGAIFLESLKETEIYKNKEGKEGISDLIQLNSYLKLFDCDKDVVYDLSLARGSDYYTGIIFEASYKNHQIGAVLGGGRYDNLVTDLLQNETVQSNSNLSANKDLKPVTEQSVRTRAVTGQNQGTKPVTEQSTNARAVTTTVTNKSITEQPDHPASVTVQSVPCVGFSVGIARILSILEKKNTQTPLSSKVFVASSGKSLLEERMKVLNVLWNNKISAETLYNDNNFRKQAAHCNKNNIPIMVIIGENELENEEIQITLTGNLKDKKTVKMEEMIINIMDLLNKNNL